MKLKKLMTARAVISKCAGEKLPAHVAYKFARFIRLTDGDENFYHEKFNTILDNYAKKDEEGNLVRDGEFGIALKPETTEDCRREMHELENTEVELPFHFSMKDMSCLTLSIKDCFGLEDLIKEEGNECH